VRWTVRRLRKAKRFWGKYWVCVMAVGVRLRLLGRCVK